MSQEFQLKREIKCWSRLPNSRKSLHWHWKQRFAAFCCHPKMHCLPSRRHISRIWADWQRLCRRLNNDDSFERIFSRFDFRVWGFLVCIIKRSDPNRVRDLNLRNCRLQCLLRCRKTSTTRCRPEQNREDYGNYLHPRLKNRRSFN